ncbi:MAG: hypothetical protein ACRCYO_05760 [Bacteroidia bacterium]
MQKNDSEFLFFDSVKMMTSKSLKQFDAVMIATKEYVFLIPTQSVLILPIVQTFTTHRYFVNGSVSEGCLKLIADAANPNELEQTLMGLLEGDEKFIHKLSNLDAIKVNRWFSTFNFRLLKGKMGYTAILVKGKEKADVLKTLLNI